MTTTERILEDMATERQGVREAIALEEAREQQMWWIDCQAVFAQIAGFWYPNRIGYWIGYDEGGEG